MGNGCTRNLRRLNKSGVAPNPSSHSDGGSDNTSLPKIIPANPPDDSDKSPHLVAPNHIDTNRRPNCIEIGPGESHKPFSGSRLQLASSSHHEMPSTSQIGKTDQHNLRNTFYSSSSRASTFDSDAFNLSSCIDTKSIIFDKTESATTARPPSHIARSMSVDSSSDKSDEKSSDGKRFTAAAGHLQRLFKSNQNLTTLTSPPTTTPPAATVKNGGGSLSFPKLYHRFSGSVQSLFGSNLQSNRKRNLSASDTNLNRINRRCNGLSQQQLIDNDYCPSVFYNRKARKSYSEKNLDKTQTFSRWKNQLWLKFSRKKSNPSARKS